MDRVADNDLQQLKQHNKMINKEQRDTIWFYTKTSLTIIIVIAIGLWGMNQFLDMYYKEQLLAGPCQTCVALNPRWGECYDYLKQVPNIIETNYTLDFTRVKLLP